jgi:hypothetical protein
MEAHGKDESHRQGNCASESEAALHCVDQKEGREKQGGGGGDIDVSSNRIGPDSQSKGEDKRSDDGGFSTISQLSEDEEEKCRSDCTTKGRKELEGG